MLLVIVVEMSGVVKGEGERREGKVKKKNFTRRGIVNVQIHDPKHWLGGG